MDVFLQLKLVMFESCIAILMNSVGYGPKRTVLMLLTTALGETDLVHS